MNLFSTIVHFFCDFITFKYDICYTGVVYACLGNWICIGVLYCSGDTNSDYGNCIYEEFDI